MLSTSSLMANLHQHSLICWNCFIFDSSIGVVSVVYTREMINTCSQHSKKCHISQYLNHYYSPFDRSNNVSCNWCAFVTDGGGAGEWNCYIFDKKYISIAKNGESQSLLLTYWPFLTHVLQLLTDRGRWERRSLAKALHFCQHQLREFDRVMSRKGR